MSIFDKDFFPTPPDVITQMLTGVDISGKSVLEPSAGKGNIVDELNRLGADQVLTFEKNEDLATIVMDKSKYLGRDFMEATKEQLSHIDFIIMNPPFSRDEQHILHAWDVAPEGCQIIALCNSETVNNQYTTYRKRLGTVIKDYGDASQNLGDCFSKSERKTGVEVTLVKLFKPIVSDDFDYEGFFMEEEPREIQAEGLMPYNEIRSIVERYIGAVKCFDEFKEVSDRMDQLVNPVGLTDGFSYKVGYNNEVTTKLDFSKELQKTCWKHIFSKMNMGKYVTSGVMEDINKFVETQSKYPFTMKNIYRMLDVIIQTRGQTMDRALEEAFDKITMHYHDNRYHLEGWKTNSHYLINEKFILPNVVEPGFRGEMKFKISSWGNAEKLMDLTKALSYITGQHKETVPINQSRAQNGNLVEYDRNQKDAYEDLDFHTKYDWGFFEVRGYKKGTLHCWFKDEKVWEMFNRRVAEIKGFPLPEKI
ncbi:MAG: DNA methyltransferase [Balneola sp.]|nr:DNA methyltransferase [Balneola sp.]|tara:strand:+ start:13265 stop:14698 length:1434 start_codon:yes stop_codon:yes gene_type:complete